MMCSASSQVKGHPTRRPPPVSMMNFQNNMAITLGSMNARANFIAYMEMMGNYVDPQ